MRRGRGGIVRAGLVRRLPFVLWAAALSVIVALLAFPLFAGEGLSDVVADPVVIAFFCFVIAFVSVGALVAAKRPENPLGWIMLAAGIAYSVAGFATAWLEEYATPRTAESLPVLLLGWITTWAWLIGPFISVTFLLLLFPDGHVPSRGWRHVARAVGIGIAMMVVGNAITPGPMDLDAAVQIDNPLGIESLDEVLEVVVLIGAVVGFAGVLLSPVSLFVRYRGASSKSRMQIKWLAYAAAAAVMLITVVVVIEGVVGSAAAELTNFTLTASLTMLPIAIGIAILRHRLFDIDRIINRTIVYAVVTGSALTVYAATVFVIGTVVVGPSDNLTVAVATLAAAAIFRPALRRVQGFVDRRFYRQRYDAAHTIDAFGARLREETDLDELTEDLVGVVRTTMQPEHVSVWLKIQGTRP
jgi:hypothetical protein